MSNRNLFAPTLLVLLSLSSDAVRAETIRPIIAPSTSVPWRSASAEETFVCGTYRGNENQSLELYHLYQSALQKTSPAATAAMVYDDVWIIEDDGTLTLSGNNPFDTDLRTFRFTPNGGGGYTITSATFTYDAVLGTDMNMTDDGNSLRTLAFTFNYFGTDWSNIQVSSNGAIAFGAVINPSGAFDSDDFFNNVPKIAAYFLDLLPSGTTDVYFKSEATKATITWNNIREFGTTSMNRFQVVLRDDDSFDVTFNGIATMVATNGLPITAGIHPGGGPPLDAISFSADIPYVGGAGTGFYEQYYNFPNPRVNEVALVQRFYQNFPDVYFQILFFTNFVQTMSGFANELNIKNDVQGIGLGTFDNSTIWGSNGVLESRCNMNRLDVWPADPTNRFFGGGNNFLTITGQEAGHRWGAFICFDDPNQTVNDPGCGAFSSLLLGRAYAHWSYYADVDHSSLEGGNWQFVSGNLFTAPTTIDYFGDIDEYILGLRTPQEVTTAFYVSSPTNNLLGNRSLGSPLQGATATGTEVTVTIDDIITANGARIPTEASEDKDLRQAFIVLLQNGTSLSQADLDKIANFRRSWEDYFEVSVDGRITCNTSLTQDLPVGVVQGLVWDGGHQPLDSITVKALERGFEQFVVAGGRYTFRFMPESLPPTDSCVTLVFSAPGYQPDTLVTCIPYNSTVTQNVTLFGLITGVQGDQPIPVASTVLNQNYPNPFNPRTTLTYVLRQSGHVHLAIYDTQGRRIRTLVEGIETSGEHRTDWNGQSDAGVEVSSGVYFVRLDAGGAVRTRKVVLLK